MMMAKKSAISGPGYVYFATGLGIYRNIDPTVVSGWSRVYGASSKTDCWNLKFGPNGTGICTDTYNILRSADGGETWTAVQSNTSTSHLYISLATNGKGLWICSARTGYIVHSTDDGLTWTATASNVFPNGSVISVAYGNGKFVAVKSQSTSMATSSDGINWTVSTKANISAYNMIGNGIAFYDGKFYNMTDSLAPETSEDGVTWTKYNAPAYVSGAACVGKFGSTYIYAGKRDAGGTIWTSSDLSSWTVVAEASVSGLCIGVLDDSAITGDTYFYYNIFRDGVWKTYYAGNYSGINISSIAKW